VTTIFRSIKPPRLQIRADRSFQRHPRQTGAQDLKSAGRGFSRPMDRIDSFNIGKKQRKQNFGAECTIADGQRQLNCPIYMAGQADGTIFWDRHPDDFSERPQQIPVRNGTGEYTTGMKGHLPQKAQRAQIFFCFLCLLWQKMSTKRRRDCMMVNGKNGNGMG
jgi:hypothetical protein